MEIGKEIHWDTSKGKVRIRTFCSPAEIRKYKLDGQFSIHARYKSLYTKRESLERIAGQTETNVALAFIGDQQIIGLSGCGSVFRPGPGQIDGLTVFPE